jgi:DNA modification methylase
MHKELDKVWKNIAGAVKEGGIVCINIGDAVRSINREFKLYSNHSRIISAFLNLGFNALPDILWRKQTNSPNKFMGSGMLPPGAYVTLEHE